MATTSTFGVIGMTCNHCVNAVREELTALPGVRAVDVDLNAGGSSRVTLVSDEPVDEVAVRSAVDEAGYSLDATAS